MDQTTQQNAAMVEQTSAAARNLAVEAGGLTQQSSRFTVGETGGKRTLRRFDTLDPTSYTALPA